MFQLGQKHGGHAVHGGAALAVERGQHLEGIERFKNNHGCAVVYGSRNAQHAAKAVEQRHGQAHPVIGAEILVTANPVAVEPHPHMGQHDATRKTRGSRRILHVDDIPRLQLGLTGGVFRIVHHDGERKNFGHGIHAPVLFGPQKTHALEVRQAFAHQPVARLQAQLWRNAVQRVEVVVVAHTVDEKNIFTLRVREQIAQLVLAVVGVYRN